jgi:hypothetical protein
LAAIDLFRSSAIPANRECDARQVGPNIPHDVCG